MKNSLNNKKIFVAGHNGMVGSSIVKYFYKKGIKKIITKSRKSLDLTNKKKVFNFITSIIIDFFEFTFIFKIIF